MERDDEHFGVHRVTRRIAKGPIALIYEVEHEGNLRVVKVLNRLFSRAQDLREEFLDEAHRLVTLKNRFLIEGFEVGFTTDDRPYFVMERASRTVADLVAQARPTIGEALGIVDSVADALGYLHAKSLVHRDVKPKNIFLFDHDTPTAKLGDLGLARNFSYTLTTTGTAGYTAVELLEGRSVPQEFRMRADVYSLAVVAAELITGSMPPFHFRDRGQWSDQLPKDIATVLLSGMHNDPGNRCPDPMQFAADLRYACHESNATESHLL
jgi:eukaryotic-like serine/threonine-protein kinase